MMKSQRIRRYSALLLIVLLLPMLAACGIPRLQSADIIALKRGSKQELPLTQEDKEIFVDIFNRLRWKDGLLDLGTSHTLYTKNTEYDIYVQDFEAYVLVNAKEKYAKLEDGDVKRLYDLIIRLHEANKLEYTYEFQRVNGALYIAISPDILNFLPTPPLEFASAEALYDALTGDISQDLLGAMFSRLRTDENSFLDGKTRFRILDLESFCAPIVPDNCTPVADDAPLKWGGDFYSIEYTAPYSDNVLFRYTDNEKRYGYLGNSVPDEDEITQTEGIADRNGEVTYYTRNGNDYKLVSYSLTDGDKTNLVHEIYLLRSDNANATVSETIPKEVKLYGSRAHSYYFVSITALNARPDVQDLLSFGIAPLQPDPTE